MTQEKKTGEKTAPTQNELEAKAASALLSEYTEFKITGLGTFKMSPLKLGTLIHISKDALKIEPLNKPSALNVIASANLYAKPAATIVAKAILNGKLKIMFFSGIFSRLLLWKLSAAELNQLVGLMLQKSNADFFFLSTSQLGAMRIMAPTQEMTASGAQSQE